MPPNTRVREFFYVDVERSRSLLAQLDRGIVESVVQSSGLSVAGEAQAKLFGLGGRGSLGHERTSDESRSLQDLVFSIFEEKAEEQGYLSDLSNSVDSKDAWESGRIHASLNEGQLVRLTSDVLVLDPAFLGDRLGRLNEFAEVLLALNAAESTQDMQKSERQRRLREARKQLWGGIDPTDIGRISQLITSLLAGSIAARVLPLGRDFPELSFGGILLGRSGYIQPEREALFSRYGAILRDWTVVMQIATIPDQSSSSDEMPDFSDLSLTTVDNAVNRAAVELVAIQLAKMLETVGFSEGPKWPSVAMTPLAIYRSVPYPSTQNET